MIGSLFKDSSRGDREKEGGGEPPDECAAATADEALLSAFPLVSKIARFRAFAAGRDDRLGEPADLVQRVFARLLAWRDRNRDKSAEMNSGDWGAFAARTTFNESNRLSRGPGREHLSLEDLGGERLADARAAIEGNSGAEAMSLAVVLWSEITSMSLRQRRALLLSSAKGLAELTVCGISSAEMMDALGFEEEEFIDVVGRLPLTDGDIATLIAKEQGGKPISAGAVKKARFEARQKLREATRK